MKLSAGVETGLFFGGVPMDKDFPMHKVVLQDGMAVAYMDVPTGDAPVVWIHGMGSYRETFHPIFRDPPVPARHIALDLPGFGDSAHLHRRHELSDYARWVDEFLGALNLSDVVLAGHSFGGMVVGETLDRYPERIRGAILIGAAGWLDPENVLSPTPYFCVNRVGIWVTGLGYFGREMLRALGVDPDRVSRGDRRRLRRGWQRAYEMARMGTFYHSADFARRVLTANRPVAVIHGSQDSLFPIDKVTRIVADRAPLWVIEGSGHVPFLSHPHLFWPAFRAAYAHAAKSQRNDTR
jgi:pimeloyl-ACP methyl ester carboxylesterase